MPRPGVAHGDDSINADDIQGYAYGQVEIGSLALPLAIPQRESPRWLLHSAVFTDDAPFAAATGALADVSAGAGASDDSDSVESVRAAPVAPAAPASLTFVEDCEFIMRPAFEHCGCNVGDESLQQEVLDVAALEHGVLVECDVFQRRE